MAARGNGKNKGNSSIHSTNGFTEVLQEEDEVLKVHVTSGGATQDISLHSHYSSMQAIANGMDSTNGAGPQQISASDSASSSPFTFRRPRPQPPLNPLTLNGPVGMSDNEGLGQQQQQQQQQSSASDSPFLRRLDSFRRSSTEFSISSFRQSYSNSNNNSNSTTANNQDFDELNAEPSLDQLGVKSSTSSESQAFYGNDNTVKELRPEYVRWFYKYEQDRTWNPFTGYDSLRLEERYRALILEREAAGGTFHASQAEIPDALNGYTYNNAQNEYYYDYQHQHQEYNGYNNYNEQHLHGYDGFDSCQYTQENYYTDNNAQVNNCAEALNHLTYAEEHEHQEHENSPYYSNYDAQHLNYNAHENAHLPDSFDRLAEDKKGVEVEEENTEKGKENVIVVRQGLYEADLDTLKSWATYWTGDECQIIRGTWFYDGTWQPLSTEHAEKLEEEHLGQFAGVSLTLYHQVSSHSSISVGLPQPESPSKKGRPVIHHVSFSDFHVDWTSPSEIHLFSKAASYKFMRSVGQRLGFQTWGHRLCRGYCKPASLDDKPSDITHLVFVVHGIGQKMDTGRIVRNCAQFREVVAQLKEKLIPQLRDINQQAEFFPVEWRSGAKLDGDIVDAITPHKLLSLRQMLNATCMDIMYYTSPLYRTEIQNALKKELNGIYSNFIKRNPDFKTKGGKVSVIAHSLGAVITYDIITGYNMSQSPQVHLDTSSSGPNMEPEGLPFKLEHFFCFGSPLSVFLALSWKDPSSLEQRSKILPPLLCKRIYNIFYSSDPVAYRMEPLLNKYYVHIAPLSIHPCGATNVTKYEEMPKERINKEVRHDPSNTGPMHHAHSSMGASFLDLSKTASVRNQSLLKSPPTPSKESWGWASLMKYLKNEGEAGSSSGLASPEGNSSFSEEGNTSPDISNEIPNDLEYRIDYMLRESSLSSGYFQALTSHTSYWSSPDTAFFVFQRLYGDFVDTIPQLQNLS